MDVLLNTSRAVTKLGAVSQPLMLPVRFEQLKNIRSNDTTLAKLPGAQPGKEVKLGFSENARVNVVPSGYLASVNSGASGIRVFLHVLVKFVVSGKLLIALKSNEVRLVQPYQALVRLGPNLKTPLSLALARRVLSPVLFQNGEYTPPELFLTVTVYVPAVA